MPVSYLQIDDSNDVGQRLDNYLLKTLKGVPKSQIYRIIRRGEVRVNSGRVAVSYRLEQGDRIRVPPLRFGTAEQVDRGDALKLGERLLEHIIYEDEDLLILDKPHGVPVHGGSSISSGVIEAIREVRLTQRYELVHRLDKQTSGLLAVAKNRRSLAAIQKAFRERQVSKVYEVVVWGQWPHPLRTVQFKLKRYLSQSGERRVRVDTGGQSARTDFEILDACETATRLQARLHTGRTHQIRVHTSASGHPVVGDEKYEDPKTAVYQPSRMMLHARKLAFPHNGSLLKFTSLPGQDFEKIWMELKNLS